MKFALIRADGNSNIGMGHLTREIDIAQELKKNDYEITFLTKDFSEGTSLISENGFNYLKLSIKDKDLKSSIEEINRILKSFKENFDLIIIDLLKNFDNQDYLDNLKNYCKNLIIITDHTNRLKIKADIVFALSQNQNPDWYRNLKQTKFYTGLDYFPLGKQYKNVKKEVINKKVENILITFGGTDSVNYTTRIVKIMKNFNLSAKITLIIGPGFSNENNQKLMQELDDKIIVKRNVKNMLRYFIETDLCICSAGNTLIELLTCGVPCIVLPQTEREAEHALAIEKSKVLINLGKNWEEQGLLSIVNNLVKDYQKRKELSKAAQQYFDGRGLDRIIEILLGK